MSFSTTLYRISLDLFDRLESGSVKPGQLVSDAIEFITLQNSTDAMIFILKRRTSSVPFDIEEIFFPRESKGSVSDEEFQKLVDARNYKEIDRIVASTFHYLTPDKVIAISSFLNTLNREELKMLYDPEALNLHQIYPSLWTSDEDPENAYNFDHLSHEFDELKRIFEYASIAKDYILSFSG